MSDAEAARELTALARAAAWGLVTGGDLDSLREDGPTVLLERWNILDAAARAGITIDLDEQGIGAIYSRESLEGLVRDFRPRDPRTGRVVR